MVEAEPTVSVVIPVYNCERYLAHAIESAIAQEKCLTRIIVVDDGSSDGSASAAKDFGDDVHYIFQEHAGAAAARNRGIEAADSAFLAFLDADDLWTAGRLECMLAELLRDPHLDMVFGRTEEFICPSLVEDERKKLQRLPPQTPGYVVGAMLARRESFLRAGLFDTTLRIGEFIAWFVLAKRAALRFSSIDDVVLRRRLHAANLMRRSREAYGDYLRIIRDKIAFERAQDGAAHGESNLQERKCRR
jgi:glycosyltransferase involved in cell wall biosynthesis